MITEADLSQFYGTETLYKYSILSDLRLTDGTKYLADEGQAYWLMDAISSHQLNPKVRKEGFQIWTLKVDDEKAVLTCQRDSGTKPIVTQRITYTDFPLAEIKLYVENKVICLPSER